MPNYNRTSGIICTSSPGQSIENFVSELITLRKKELGVIVGIFNDRAQFIHSQDTEQDIVKRYMNR